MLAFGGIAETNYQRLTHAFECSACPAWDHGIPCQQKRHIQGGSDMERQESTTSMDLDDASKCVPSPAPSREEQGMPGAKYLRDVCKKNQKAIPVRACTVHCAQLESFSITRSIGTYLLYATVYQLLPIKYSVHDC